MTATEISPLHDRQGDLPAAGLSEDRPAETPADEEEVLWVDPRELIISDNVRTNIRLERGFVADIKERGVRQIIPVHRDEHGRLVLLTGQKRVLAAIEAGLNRVRVLVEPPPHTDERDRQIGRIIEQLGENEHRASISDADEARATQQLMDLGLSAGQIARRRHIGTKRVKTAAVVAGNPTAMDAVADGRLDLAQAAVVAEFAVDAAAVEKLTTAARTRPEQFDHLAQQLRDDREEARLRAELTATLTAQGVRVIDRPDTLFGGRVRRPCELRATPDTEPGNELTAEAHASCPGHAAFVDDRGTWRPAAERVVAVWLCTDAPAHGHAERYTAVGVTTIGKLPGPMTEEQKAERHMVIANNKAWDSATTVRRDWLRTFLARKAAPAEGARWVAQMLAQGSHEMRRAMQSDHQLASDLLGLQQPDRGCARTETHVIAANAVGASTARATTLTVAMLIGALEDGTDRHTWRCPTRDQIAYFRQLQAWNYPLSDVEHLVITPAHAEEPSQPDPADNDATCDGAGKTTDVAGTEEAEPVPTTDDPDLAA